jgi:uncharacterized protein
MHVPIVRDTKTGVVLFIHLQPNASTTECVGIHGDAIKIRVTAPPVDGAANDELIRFFARQLSTSVPSIQIKSGISGRRKRVVVKGVTAEFVLACLNLGPQKWSAKG